MPQIKTISLKELDQNKNLEPELLIKKEKIIQEYKLFFKGQILKNLLDVIQITFPKTIKKGDLVFQNRGINFNLKISEVEKENKARLMVFKIKDETYTASFIIWFFSQKEIQNYLSLYSQGNLISFLPKKALEELQIILPTKSEQNLKSVNITSMSEFKEIIKKYYEEYQRSITQKNFLSASFLVGSICEAILYQFLRDKGVKKQLIKGKMYGNLIEILEIRGDDIMNLEDFKKIRTFRNLIHPKNALKNINNISIMEKEIEFTFNKIIKNFGI